MHVARRFELFLDNYHRPGGGKWGGADLEKATGGIVSLSYVANLRKGRIENPGYKKMRVIAKAMGFPPEAWFGEMPASGARTAPGRGGTSPGGSSASSGRSDTRRPASPTRAPRSPA